MTWLMMTKDDPLIFDKYVHLLNSVRISRGNKAEQSLILLKNRLEMLNME